LVDDDDDDDNNKNNNYMDFKEIECEDVHCIRIVRMVGFCEYHDEPSFS
jgi:hypothetical protein